MPDRLFGEVPMLDHIAEVRKLGLPLGSYIVVGGSCLAVRGIRESQDIDMVVTPMVFDWFKTCQWPVDEAFKKKWGRERLVHAPFEVLTDFYIPSSGEYLPASVMIERAEYIDGVAFMTLDELLVMKRENGRPKDLADIALIEEYLARTAPGA